MVRVMLAPLSGFPGRQTLCSKSKSSKTHELVSTQTFMISRAKGLWLGALLGPVEL